MSKQVTIPISSIDKFITDGTFVGVAFRFRLKNKDSGDISQWSPVQLLKFSPYYSDSPIQIVQTNGSAPITSSRSSSFNYSPITVDAELPSSQIDQISSQATDGHTPKLDTYKYSWSKPINCNVKNFDVYASWNIFSYLSTVGTLSAPSGTGPYTGTLTLTANSYNSAITLKSLYDFAFATNDLKIFAGPGTATLGNNLIMTGYSSGNIINVKSASTWTAGGGTIRNISRTHAWTNFEYVRTTAENSVTFSRKMTSNKLTATITKDTCVIKVNESLLESGVVPGMTLTKISGDGSFAGSAVVSQVNYQDNYIIVSPYQLASTVASSGGTVGTVSANSATITGITLNVGTQLSVGTIITATAGIGSLGNGVVRVTAVNSATSVTVQSTASISQGTITNITIATPANHTTSGYIEFIAENEKVNTTYNSSATTLTADPTGASMPINQYWSKPMFVQTVALASTENKESFSEPNLYTLFAVSESQSTYFDGYATVGTIAGTGPYTARLTNMSFPYSSNLSNVGARLYGGNSGISAGTVALGPTATASSGETKIADYVNGVRTDIIGTTNFTAGVVVSLRV